MKKSVFSNFFHFVCLLSSILICLSTFFSCKKKPSPEEIENERVRREQAFKKKLEQAKENALSDYVRNLAPEVKVSQLFLVNVEGKSNYSAVEKVSSVTNNAGDDSPLMPGGVLLFSYNISNDPLESYDYIKSIHDFYVDKQNPPPFVAVDQEGGDVNRLRFLTSVLLSQKEIADSFTPEKAFLLYQAQARQMKNLGFHMNLAPVVEVMNEENREFLDTRSFGSLEKVLEYGGLAVRAYEENGISVVLKHFPGNSSTDPHIGLPKISIKGQDKDNYFKPFQTLLPAASGILMSHAIVQLEGEADDSQQPACFSSYWIQDVLKKQFSFNGLVISDDIFMGALAKNGYPPESAAVKALEAGVDVIMLSEKKFGKVAGSILEEAEKNAGFAAELDRAVENVILYKIKAGILELVEKEPVSAETVENFDGQASSPEEASDGKKVPFFEIRVNPLYHEFNLEKFDGDYLAGMKAYN